MRLAVFTVSSLFLPLIGVADPLTAARNVSDEGPVYAYEIAFQSDEISATGTVDPTKPVGQRIAVTSPPVGEWPEDFAKGIERMDEQADGDIWCTDFARNIPINAELTSEDGATATYTFQPEPDSETGGTQRKLFKKLVATAVVAKDVPGILSFQMHLPESMKPNLLAKIDRFSMFVQCERAPDGRTYRSDFAIDIAGSAFGRSFEENIRQQITRLVEPGSS